METIGGAAAQYHEQSVGLALNAIQPDEYNGRMIGLHTYRRWLAGLLVGLGAAHIGSDFFTPDILIPVFFAFGFGLGLSARPRWTLWGLALYLVAPYPMRDLALLAVALALTGWLHQAKLPRPAIIGGVVAFVVLVLTLSPGILPADAGEYQVVAAEFGIAHPPGYPLYTLLSGTFARLIPLATMAWRVNLFSALIGALTVAVTVHMVRRETGNEWSGLLAGAVLLTATTFWMTSTQASIRPLTVLFTALMLEAALAYRTRHAAPLPNDGRFALLRFGLAAGFGVAHHGSIFFIGLIFALWMALAGWRHWRQWWIAPAAALTGLLPIVYLPLRSGAFLAPEYITTLDGLRYHVLAEGFAGDMFALARPDLLADRVQVMIEVFRLQWPLVILVLAAVGLIVTLVRDRWLGSMLLVALAVHTFVAGTYRAPQIVEYTLPAYLVLAVLISNGRAVARPYKPYMDGSFVPVIFAALTLFGVMAGFERGWTTMRRLASLEEARIMTERVLDQADDGTIILSNWHRVTPIWYLQQVEDKGRDNPAYYVASSGRFNTPMDEWAAAISENMVGDAVVVTQHFPETFRFLPYTIENDVVRQQPRPAGTAEPIYRAGPAALTGADIPAAAHSGETGSITLDWHLDQAVDFGTLTGYIHLGAVDSPPLAQLDLPFQVNAPGRVRIRYDLFIPPTVPPGTWPVFAGAYGPDGGPPRVQIGTIDVGPAAYPLPTQHPLHIDMGPAVLRGWDYDTSQPDAARLYLHWIIDDGFTAQVVDGGGQVVSSQTAGRPETDSGRPEGRPYWTSAHVLPPNLVHDLRVAVVRNEAVVESVRLPTLPHNERYVIFGDLAALIGWNLETRADGTYRLTLDWLAAGASHSEIAMSFGVPFDDSPPITDAIPTTKWAYGHRIRSVQTFTTQPESLSLYDSFTGRFLYASVTGGISLMLSL